MTGPWYRPSGGFDPQEGLADARDVADARSLVTGTLVAMLHNYSQDEDRAVLIDKVDMVDDMHGNHQPMVRLRMRSGAKLLVIVAEDT